MFPAFGSTGTNPPQHDAIPAAPAYVE